MEREQIVRNDFPLAVGEDGFDPDSVVAHLTAVAAHVAALESMINALEVEREALRRLGAVSPGESQTGSHPDEEIQVEGREDEVSARLTASTLALEGADRETIRARLDSEYRLTDIDALLDDVLARLA